MRPAFFLLVTALASCQASAKHEDGSATAQQEASQLRVIFVVTPVIAHNEVRAGLDTIWSASEDRDSVLVLLMGAPLGALVDASVDAKLKPIDLDDPPTEPATRSILWKTLPARQVSTLPERDEGRIIAVLVPSELDADSSLLGADEAVVGFAVRVQLSSGEKAVSHLRVLPGI